MICFLIAGFTSKWIIFLAMIVPVAMWRTQWTTWKQYNSTQLQKSDSPLRCLLQARWSFQNPPQTSILPTVSSAQRRTPAAFSARRPHRRWPSPRCWAWWWQEAKGAPWRHQAEVEEDQGAAATRDHQGCCREQAFQIASHVKKGYNPADFATTTFIRYSWVHHTT